LAGLYDCRLDYDVFDTASPSNCGLFVFVYLGIRKETQKSSLRLLAPLMTLFNWRCINLHVHSFIHSFIHSISEKVVDPWSFVNCLCLNGFCLSQLL